MTVFRKCNNVPAVVLYSVLNYLCDFTYSSLINFHHNGSSLVLPDSREVEEPLNDIDRDNGLDTHKHKS